MAENCCIAEQLEDAGLAKATAVDPMQEVQGLILAVMAERYKAKASRWREYLDFIPQDMTHMPMYWKEEELRELRGTAALDKMEGKVQVPADAPTQVRMRHSGANEGT
ncbi:hypothetical protein DUNSADRAFT_2219 [Dunaliella salina]|uniref:Uncharacterized protein n=1 Tax=Dunaliella salina TaxID=3046 RepID=A0ABQ7FWK0_DUNSA|nr:hypothetical protein DUNSADRAFT_2219 [Dunaliella salina]|eukprot:KAF5826733.1 hypothetical protein DUNSADRAFT_2219 [Dunaliella salina]